MKTVFLRMPGRLSACLTVIVLFSSPVLLFAQPENLLVSDSTNKSANISANKSAINPAEQSSSVSKHISRLLDNASFNLSQNNYEEALTDLITAYNLAKQYGDRGQLGNILNAMANTYYEYNNYPLARRYYEQILELQLLDKKGRAATLFNLGHVSASQGNHIQAENEFLESLSLSEEINDLSGKAFALKALGVNFQSRANIPVARDFFINSQQVFGKLDDEIQVAHLNRHLGELALANEDPSQAISLYIQALTVYMDRSIFSGMKNTYRGLSSAYEQLQDFQRALIAYKAFNVLLQDQMEQQGLETTQQLKVALETQRYVDENDELETLNQSQHQELIQQETLLRKQYQINALVLGVVFLIAVLFVRSQNFARQMKILATTDELTGLCNRRAILKFGHEEMQRAKRFGRPFSCLMFDIDHFKSINDTFGHETGDVVLKEVAQLIKTTLRQTDRVGRIGGEEFLLIAPETDPKDATLLAERIRKKVERSHFDKLKGRSITVSIGLAQSLPEQSLEELISHADGALYTAKADGRNQSVVFQA